MRYTVSYKDSSFGEVSFDVEMEKTPKTVTIKPIGAKPKYGYGDFPLPGCIDKLWDKGQIRICTDEEMMKKKNRVPRDVLKDWGDGTFTLYPGRRGVPFLLEPEKEE